MYDLPDNFIAYFGADTDCRQTDCNSNLHISALVNGEMQPASSFAMPYRAFMPYMVFNQEHRKLELVGDYGFFNAPDHYYVDPQTGEATEVTTSFYTPNTDLHYTQAAVVYSELGNATRVLKVQLK